MLFNQHIDIYRYTLLISHHTRIFSQHGDNITWYMPTKIFRKYTHAGIVSLEEVETVQTVKKKKVANQSSGGKIMQINLYLFVFRSLKEPVGILHIFLTLHNLYKYQTGRKMA